MSRVLYESPVEIHAGGYRLTRDIRRWMLMNVFGTERTRPSYLEFNRAQGLLLVLERGCISLL